MQIIDFYNCCHLPDEKTQYQNGTEFDYKDLGQRGGWLIIEGNTVLFCGNDVARALGYSRPRDAITDHTKGAVKRRYLSAGGEQEMSFIPESDHCNCVTKRYAPTSNGAV